MFLSAVGFTLSYVYDTRRQLSAIIRVLGVLCHIPFVLCIISCGSTGIRSALHSGVRI